MQTEKSTSPLVWIAVIAGFLYFIGVFDDEDTTSYSDESTSEEFVSDYESDEENLTDNDYTTYEDDESYVEEEANNTDTDIEEPHYDSSYQYEYRSGTSGNYTYNYDVAGEDIYNSSSVSGNLDMRGKYGDGYIIDENGNEIQVDAEWTGYGEIEATDSEGNTYTLETE